ncbi:MAG: Gfo/Idh/MocA family oxidoreductase [Anaerolineae bacterium]|nr:Gfo/Idh/MocA family oxidoreductase [Anaerolineae bacterium]
MAKEVKVAILGCGGFARKRQTPNLAALPEVQIVACCDQVRASAEALAREVAGDPPAVYTDCETMLDAAKPDALYVALPPYTHGPEVEEAARRGIHIFIEKPIALDMQTAWRMVEAAERAGIVTQVDFQFRFGVAVEWVHSKITSGAAGTPGLMLARYFCNSLHAPWWRQKDKSGGQLVEQVIHMIDLLRHLLGQPTYVFSRQANLFHQDVPDYTSEDVSGTIVSFENGALGVIAATNGAIPGRWINEYHVVTRNLTADFIDANHATVAHTDQDPPGIEEVGGERDAWAATAADFIAAIMANRPARIPLREGALSLELALAATASAERQKEMQLHRRV